MRQSIFRDDVQELLNRIARGDVDDIRNGEALMPVGLSDLWSLNLLSQDFSLTPHGWEYVTCPKAIAMRRLKEPTVGHVPPCAWKMPGDVCSCPQDRAGPTPGGMFARSLFAGMLDDT